MADTLRAQAIRLAASLPQGDALRREIIATVKEAALEPKWQNTVAGEKVRIRWNLHPRGAVLIEELPSRGKKRLQRATFSVQDTFSNIADAPNSFMVENLLRDFKPSPSMSYDQAVTAFKGAIAEATAHVDAGKAQRGRMLHQWERSQLAKLPYQSDVFYLEVEPADYSPLEIQGKDFVMKAEWGEFEAFSPNSDFQQMDPHYSVKEQKSPAAARKLFKILKADPEALRSINWSGLGDWLTQNGVAFETHHSQWR